MASEPKAAVPEEFLKHIDEDMRSHDVWAARVDRNYRAWRGVMEQRSEASKWRSKMHPPYLWQLCETLVAGLVDPSPRWKVTPRPRMVRDQTDLSRLRDGARSVELLLAAQRSNSGFLGMQRQHRLQGLIAGLTVWKPYWRYEERTVKREQQTVEFDAAWGENRLVSQMADVTDVLHDDPAVDLVDVRDWIWHEAAVSVEKAKRITHRVWMTFDELKKHEANGFYRNVDELKESRSFAERLASRESDLFNTDRTKDMIEVLEYWCDGGARVVTIGNRKTVLQDRANPFNHGRYPFIACSPIPELFRIPGISIVEQIEQMQEILWTLQNQRADNLELVNNAIVLMRDDVLDPASFVFAPGEMWLVSDPGQVQMWQPNTDLARVSIDAEMSLKMDMQNIVGANPSMQGTADGMEQTATEVSLLASLAQRRLAQQEYQFRQADIEVGEHWIKLNSQFMSEPRMLSIVGEDGEEGWELVSPEGVQDVDWRLEVAQMNESLIRQEKRAEAQAKFQVLLTAFQPAAMAGTPLNIKAIVEDYLDAFGVEDKARFFSTKSPAAAPGPGGGQGNPVSLPGQVGASAPQATDSNSPSNAFSQSPVAAMQQMLAASGGANNI